MKTLRYPLAAIACILLSPAAAHAGFLSNSNGPSIAISGTGIADDRYPATLKIEGGDGPITKVRAFIEFDHSDPDALDLALVPPLFNGVTLMSDACGGNPIDETFIFDPNAAGTLIDDGPCDSGTFLPSNFSPADTYPAPGPTSLTNDLNSFIGRNPNGDWNLFAVNDVNATSGHINVWGLEITTATANIVVPAQPSTPGPPNTSGVANQYPLTKTFDTPDGQVIDDLNLTIDAFNHQHPADVDMLLQAPTGETVMAMSDACGGDDIDLNFDWTFDDEAAQQFGDGVATNCTNSSIRPSDFGVPPEDMPAPAPARPYGSALSTFDGLQGGTFKLFINDDSGSDTGYIDDWNVAMTTRAAAATGFAATAVATAEGQTAQLTVNRTGPANMGPATLDVGVSDGDTTPSDYTAPPAKLQFARGETSKTIAIPIAADSAGEEAETFNVALSNPVNDAALTDATAFATVTIARSEPGDPTGPGGNRFSVGQVERKPNGSAQVPVTIPLPGQLTSDDAGAKDLLKTTDAFPETAGTTMLKIKPERGAKRKLRRGKKVKATAKITYLPNGGAADSREVSVTLKKKRK